MATQVQTKVRSIAEDPEPESSASLIVTVTDGKKEQVASIVEGNVTNASVERLPYDELLVTVPETYVGHVCDLDGVSRVELDEDMQVFSSGNLRRR
jgi:hypothetical protein